MSLTDDFCDYSQCPLIKLLGKSNPGKTYINKILGFSKKIEEHTILFITLNEDYNDKIYRNIFDKNDITVEWSGQTSGKEDKLPLNIDNIEIFYRKTSNTKFKYLGKVKKKYILHNRTDDINKLKMHFVVDTINCSIPSGTLADDLGKGTKYNRNIGRYKKDCLNKLGLKQTNNYYGSGIKKAIKEVWC